MTALAARTSSFPGSATSARTRSAILCAASRSSLPSRQRMRPDKNPKRTRGFGAEFKKEVRRWQGTRASLACHGEMLASPNKYVELDPAVKDKWGMPVLKIHHPWEATTGRCSSMPGKLTKRSFTPPGP